MEENPRHRSSCLVALLLLWPASSALGATTLRAISWQELQRGGQRPAGAELVGDRLRIENSLPAPRSYHLVTVEGPPIRGLRWALVGRLRHDDVEGMGYLELWNVFSAGAYFSRTLASAGPMRALQGSSGWRELVLPFTSNASVGQPRRLVVTLVLPGRGRVELGPLRLVELGENEDPLAAGGAGAWWGEREGSRIGGVAGTIGALLGVLLGGLISLGRGRRLALGLGTAALVVGALALVAGAVAFWRSQPYAVYYPLLLGGGISTALMICMLPIMRRRYRDLELRPMAALDGQPRR